MSPSWGGSGPDGPPSEALLVGAFARGASAARQTTQPMKVLECYRSSLEQSYGQVFLPRITFASCWRSSTLMLPSLLTS